ncbi:MAG: molybdopterin-binding protein [Atopobiaceae bacterium]|jgi:hypothetical protein
MKLIRTEDAVGHVLCHDMTQILPGGVDVDGKSLPRFKGPRFRKGHRVTKEDIPVLLSMGKEHLYVWEMKPGMLHENDAAQRLAALCLGDNCKPSGEPREGKIGINATCDGVFLVDSKRLGQVNAVDEVMVATRKGGFGVQDGDALAGTRVIPLVIDEKKVCAAEQAADLGTYGPLMYVEPYRLKTAAVIATGSEVAKGLIKDKFTPVVERKLSSVGIEVIWRATPGDNMDALVAAIDQARACGVDLIVCTGGMSVDPDDNTPGAIKRSGAHIVTYGAPVLPGAMMLLGYFEEEYGSCGATSAPGLPIVGLPGCVMYSTATVFDLTLPRIAAGVAMTKSDFVEFGEGGLCLHCDPCTYPICPFGK